MIKLKDILNEAITNPKETNPSELAKTVLGWFDFYTDYIDDGGQRRRAIQKNDNTLEWFNSHPIDIKQKAYKMMLSQAKGDKSKIEGTFGKQLKESVNEESYKVAGRPVTLIKGKKSDATDWKVKFQNGKETSLSDVLALIKPFPKGVHWRYKNLESVNESDLKGYLVADVVDDIVKSIGSKFVSGEIKNAPNKSYIYLKLTDIKFGNDVVKMLKSKFGIDAKIDKTFGNIPSVSFASKKVVSEAKSDYEVYHKSYTSAIQAAKAYAEKKGYEINDDDSFRQIGMGPKKPSEGKTNKFSIELSKDGKVQRKKLQIQVYGMRNSYELNTYIQ
jgi:hypothetical protein